MNAAAREWDIDTRFNLVTHLSSRVSFAIHTQDGDNTLPGCTALYVGDIIPAPELAALRTRALDEWHRERQRRPAAA